MSNYCAQYLITNTQSGHDLGVFQGADEWEAYVLMCRDAGYKVPADDPTREGLEDGEYPANVKVIKVIKVG